MATYNILWIQCKPLLPIILLFNLCFSPWIFRSLIDSEVDIAVNMAVGLFLGGIIFPLALCAILFPIKIDVSKDSIVIKFLVDKKITIGWSEISLIKYEKVINRRNIELRYNNGNYKIGFDTGTSLLAEFSRYAHCIHSELIISTWGFWRLKTKKIASWLGDPPDEFYKIMGIEKESVKKDDDR